MRIAKEQFRIKLLACAVAAAFVPAAYAQDDDVKALITPQSELGVGIGLVGGSERERALWGQYNGMRENDAYLLLDLDYVRRNDATGTWSILRGRNLGLDSRDAEVVWERQGDWRFSAGLDQLVHRDYRTIRTPIVGAGSTTPTVPTATLLTEPGARRDLNLEQKRQGLTLGFGKWISPSLQFEATFRNEDKEGSRLFGKGFRCASTGVGTVTAVNGVPVANPCTGAGSQFGILFFPEPLDATTRQLDTKLTFSTDRLLLTAGYYGSFYTNNLGSIAPTITDNLLDPNTGAPFAPALTTNLRNTLALPVALPPDNQAHQLFLSGNYAWTRTTRSTFKLAYTRLTQDESFAAMGLGGAPSGRTNADAQIDTLLAQFGVTARPLPKLSLNANVRYEKKHDKTPIDFYNISANLPLNRGGTGDTGNVTLWTNPDTSLTKLVGKLEGTYQLPANFRGTLGVDYEEHDRVPFLETSALGGISGIREDTREIGWHAELRRTLSETLTGAIGFAHSKRDGSIWLRIPTLGLTALVPTPDDAIVSRTAIVPSFMKDRTRNRWKASADWTPLERLSVQFGIEDTDEDYRNPWSSEKGLLAAEHRLYSVDASYELTEKWKLTSYWTLGEQQMNVAHSTGYIADIGGRNYALGFGVAGNPTGVLQVGANVDYVNDRTSYFQTLDVGATAANVTFLNTTGQLPDVTFRQTRLNLFAKYALQKNADLRFDFVHYNTRLVDFTGVDPRTGVPFLFSDGTTVDYDQKQKVNFLGATYIYKF